MSVRGSIDGVPFRWAMRDAHTGADVEADTKVTGVLLDVRGTLVNNVWVFVVDVCRADPCTVHQAHVTKLRVRGTA